MEFLSSFIKGDRVIWRIYIFLFIISMLEVYSATSTLSNSMNEYWAPFVRHFMFLAVGTGLMIAIHLMPPQYLKRLVILLPISVILLILTPLIGVKANEATRWISIFGFRFQPSELAKLSVVVTTAFMLSRMKDTEESIDATFKFLLIVIFGVCGLIAPDNFSTAGMLGLIAFIMMFIGRIPIMRLLKVAAVILSMVVVLFLLADYIPEKTPLLGRLPTWQDRFLNHSQKITKDTPLDVVFNDDNYQVSHSKIAIARGGFLPHMPGSSFERDFLPQAFSDFIYAIIIEELGLVGGFFVLAAYLILMFRAGILARRCKRSFYAFLLMGVTMMIVIQAMINMAVAVNLMPVTGQPLPLISRGGTSVLITCVYFGIILNISRTTIEEDQEEAEKLPKGVTLVNEKV